MIRLISLVILLAVFPSLSALACLNDRETVRVEKEFRSRYQSPTNPGAADAAPASSQDPSALPQTSEWHPWSIAAAAGGTALIMAAIRTAHHRLRH